MPRDTDAAAVTLIAVVSASPLFAVGVLAALDGVAGWVLRQQDELPREAPAAVPHVESGSARAAVEVVEAVEAVAPPPPAPAQVYVVHARDAAEALALHAALPAAAPAVVLGDDLHELALRSAGDARALALLTPAATAPQLRAAVAAVLAGLSVRQRPDDWPRAGGVAHAWADHEPLTPREIEVYELVGKGLSNRDIAGVLGISAHTAKYHVGQILAKVGAATRAEAVSWGLRFGLIGL